MAIFIDQVRTHDAAETVPPGITGLDWCHCVSTVSLEELQGFLAVNFPTIGVSFESIRTPDSLPTGSVCTYVGMNQAQHDAATAAGASPQRQPTLLARVFDGPASSYEP